MNELQNPGSGTSDQQPDIPLEPGSDAILLSASHVFLIEVSGIQGAAWARDADGLEHRTLHLDLRLIENLKGSIHANKGSAFSVDVPQKREDALTVSDYHGFWSHAEIEQGRRYLVVSNGTNRDLPALMKEPAIRALFNAALEQDVRLVITAEQRFGGALRKEDGQRLTAARGLLQFANERRATVRQLFSQYLWERIGPVYEEHEESLEPALIAIIGAPDSALPLREALVYGAYNAAVSPEASPQQARLLRAFLELLLKPEASAMFDRMLQVPIYNLAFRNEQPTRPAAEVIPSDAERAKMANVATGFPSARAKAVAGWLARR